MASCMSRVSTRRWPAWVYPLRLGRLSPCWHKKTAHRVVATVMGEAASGTFDVLRWADSALDPAGDTRSLRGGLQRNRLDGLCFPADCRGRLGMPELARAPQEARNEEPMTVVDKTRGVVELSALLKVEGTPDATGRKSLPVGGVRRLDASAQLLEKWRARLTADGVAPLKTGLAKLRGGVIELAFHQGGTSAGPARTGLATAMGKEVPVANTSRSALASSMCRAGPPASTTKAQAEQAHASTSSPASCFAVLLFFAEQPRCGVAQPRRAEHSRRAVVPSRGLGVQHAFHARPCSVPRVLPTSAVRP
jgi:hypothetical protein